MRRSFTWIVCLLAFSWTAGPLAQGGGGGGQGAARGGKLPSIDERTSGFKRGTGGSSGAAFLSRALELIFFPELYAVRTEIGAP